MSKRVLIHGADATLLDTRRLILLRAGLSVDVTSARRDLSSLIQVSCPDLLVICSSLPPEAREHDLNTAHAVQPTLKCLVIDAPNSDGSRISGPDIVFHAFDGPARFLKTVQKMLAD